MNLEIFLAALPVVLVCMYVYKKDVEKEPKNLLGKLMLWGVFSIIPIIFIESILDIFFAVSGKEEFIKIFLYVFISVGIIEELGKWIVSYKVVYKDKDFNEAYDAIVYTVFASLGFALIENILYVLSKGTLTGVLRAFTSVPAHTCTGVIMGYYLGLSKNEELKGNQGKSNNYMLFSIIMPALVHTAYDSFVFSQNEYSFVLFIICTITLYVVSIVLIRKVSKNNTKFDSNYLINDINYNYTKKNLIIILVASLILSIIIGVML